MESNTMPENQLNEACGQQNDEYTQEAAQEAAAESSNKNSCPEDNELQKQLDNCKIECDDWKNRFTLLSADIQNYKRRVEKEQSMWARRAQEDVLFKLLAIVDDFDRALAEHEKQEKTPELDAWLQGFELIGKSLYKFLGNMKVTEIDHIKTFDPTLHEAIAQVDMPDAQSGDIIDVVQKGFMFGDNVLRPAKVTVAK